MRITAAVLDEFHAPLKIEEVEIEEPREDEVLVKIAAAGICHTDGITRDGALPFPPPGVLGHEGAGVVAAIGDRVKSVKVGDKVVIGWPWCGECSNCLDGQPRYCVNIGQLAWSAARERTARPRSAARTARRSTATSSASRRLRRTRSRTGEPRSGSRGC